MASQRLWRHLLASSAAICSGLGAYKYYQYKENKSLELRLMKVQELFEQGKAMESAEIAKGICARVKPLYNSEMNMNEIWLSHPSNPCSWVIGNCGLYELSKCKTDFDKLIKLGWTEEWLIPHLESDTDTQYILFLFPEKSSNYQVIWATWDGLLQFLRDTDYSIFARVSKFKQELKMRSFQEIQSRSKFKFEEVDDKWTSDPRFLSKDKFLQIADEELSIVDVRLFLYCYMCVSVLFTGDGYTVDKDGNVGCKEYLIKNMPLKDIDNLKSVQLNVQPPNTVTLI